MKLIPTLLTLAIFIALSVISTVQIKTPIFGSGLQQIRTLVSSFFMRIGFKSQSAWNLDEKLKHKVELSLLTQYNGGNNSSGFCNTSNITLPNDCKGIFIFKTIITNYFK